ncbi:uncharacterized protein G2W53_028844 [Senna tora]|uniref:Uncharacterized protein n=1 Tax=Senna tora TaxID=362788 RepID=A0A834T4T4_9FABA|nr:uncharacterized protein G2W53_028844 [Senna tora]
MLEAKSIKAIITAYNRFANDRQTGQVIDIL